MSNITNRHLIKEITQAWQNDESTRTKVESKLVEILEQGPCGDPRADFRAIGNLLVQKNLECKTLAILNGLKFIFQVEGRNFQTLIERYGGVEEIVEEARRLASVQAELEVKQFRECSSSPLASLDSDQAATDGASLVTHVSHALKTMGFPLQYSLENHPLWIAKALGENSFAVINDNTRHHATAIVGLNGKNNNHFSELDSLDGRARVMDIREFVHRTMELAANTPVTRTVTRLFRLTR